MGGGIFFIWEITTILEHFLKTAGYGRTEPGENSTATSEVLKEARVVVRVRAERSNFFLNPARKMTFVEEKLNNTCIRFGVNFHHCTVVQQFSTQN